MSDLAEPRNAVFESHMDPQACRALFCAVIAEQVDLALRPASSDTPAEIAAARRWFGSGEFYVVCALAGVDGAAIAERLRAELAARNLGDPRPVGRSARSSAALPVRIGEVSFPSLRAASRALGVPLDTIRCAIARGAGERYRRIVAAAAEYQQEAGA